MNTPNASDTPRTDEALVRNRENSLVIDLIPTGLSVAANFARTLERELTAAIKRAESAEADLRSQLSASQAALAEAVKERDDANKIKSAEKLILLEEIKQHAASQAEVARLNGLLSAPPPQEPTDKNFEDLALCIDNILSAGNPQSSFAYPEVTKLIRRFLQSCAVNRPPQEPSAETVKDSERLDWLQARYVWAGEGSDVHLECNNNNIRPAIDKAIAAAMRKGEG